MIQSPWEQATALVTTEREGVRTHRQFALTSTQQSIDVPITEDDIPNMLRVGAAGQGRTQAAGASGERHADDRKTTTERSGQAGVPARLRAARTSRTRRKRLTVAVAANKEEYRPGERRHGHRGREGSAGTRRGERSDAVGGRLRRAVADRATGRPTCSSRSTCSKALQVLTEDTRQQIISRRVLTPKGDTDGGGGGEDSAPATRAAGLPRAGVLARIGRDRRERPRIVDVKLPESLTTYRIMAVAGDKASRFGSADSEIRINKPVTLKATFPRFLAVGDKASFGAVVTSQLKTAGPATVTIESLDPDGHAVRRRRAADASTSPPADRSKCGSTPPAGRPAARACSMTVKLGRRDRRVRGRRSRSRCWSRRKPSRRSARPTTRADRGREAWRCPTGVVTTFGGLHVDLASTALVGLGEGARYLVEYPYGCAEQQRVARAGAAARGRSRRRVQAARHRRRRSCGRRCSRRCRSSSASSARAAASPTGPASAGATSPYLTAYLLHVFKVGDGSEVRRRQADARRAYTYLENRAGGAAADQRKLVAVVHGVAGLRGEGARRGRPQSGLEHHPALRLSRRDAGLRAGLSDRRAGGEGRRRAARASRSSAAAWPTRSCPEAATAHVEELNDPYLLWFWNSNVRSTAIVLSTMVDAPTSDAPTRPMVALADAGAQGRALGQHAGERARAWNRSSPTTDDYKYQPNQ